MDRSGAAEQLDTTIEALADPVRRRAVELLSARPHRSSELADELGITRSAMSKHLRLLRRSGVVTERADEFDARVRIYSFNAPPMADLRAWLATAEAGWADQLGAFREHLEQGT